MDSKLLACLKRVDTPTVCNAIEVAQGKRGFNNFTKQRLISSHPNQGAIVGYAVTAKISAIAPPKEPEEIIKERRLDYYRAMAAGGDCVLAVIEDEDYPNCIGAYWGEINASIHKSLGVKGTLTNGLMRDLGDLPEDYTIISHSIGPSHGFVHVTSINTSVNIVGLSVNPGDLIHADRHGAVVIPEDVIPVIETSIQKLIASEQIILSKTTSGRLTIEAFEALWKEFEQART